jgi:zinc ribbon protein
VPQIADVLVVVLLLLAVARQVPQIAALVGRALGPADVARRERDPSRGRTVIDLVLCTQCHTAAPATARFCTRCGARLPLYRG